MNLFRLFPCAVLLAASSGVALRAVDRELANPIRKVVGLLQAMAKKVEKEGEQEKDLYEKFMCYCKTGASDLSAAISDSTAKVPSLQSDIEESGANSVRLKQELKQHQVDRSAAKAAMAEATALREKEHKAYAAESTELKGYVSSLGGAIPAIESGMAGTGLLQTKAATVAELRRALPADERLTDYDRDAVLSFLAGGAEGTSRYVPKGGEIVGILKDMLDGFSKDLAGVEKKESEALGVYEQLMQAKEKEVSTHTASIEKKTSRVGELDLSIVRMKQELTEDEAALIENQKFLNDLDSDCATKSKEMELRVKTRGEELVAIHDTIKILNDDDALELFKKTLPSSSFVQVASNKKLRQAEQKAMLILRKVAHTPKDTNTDLRFLELALMGRKVDFSKVFKMIDDMVTILKQEQVDDDAKKEYCNMQLDSAEDKAKVLKGTIHDLEIDIEEKTGAIATLKDELKVHNAGIAELDKLVAEATVQRKDENKEFTGLMSDDTAAKELLAFAKNRLQKFYNPSLYKAPPKAEAANLLQVVAVHNKQEPGPPPPTFNKGYEKKGEESGGVVQMIDLLVRDLDKEMTEAETQEEFAQKAYEELMNDSAEKRAKDVKAIQVKESAVADNEELLTNANGDLKSKKQEFMAVETYTSQLHGECDWLLQNFGLRKSARAEEMDALKQAKAVLSGADFSFVQASRKPLISSQRGL